MIGIFMNIKNVFPTLEGFADIMDSLHFGESLASISNEHKPIAESSVKFGMFIRNLKIVREVI